MVFNDFHLELLEITFWLTENRYLDMTALNNETEGHPFHEILIALLNWNRSSPNSLTANVSLGELAMLTMWHIPLYSSQRCRTAAGTQRNSLRPAGPHLLPSRLRYSKDNCKKHLQSTTEKKPLMINTDLNSFRHFVLSLSVMRAFYVPN